jgi:3'-5' exonuclease
MALIFDIETIGKNFEDFDKVTQENLTRWIKREALGDDSKYQAMLLDLKEGLGFSPLTGEIAAIGVFDTKKNQGVVYYQAPDVEMKDKKEENFIFKPRTEKEMLECFWQGVANYREFVSFNGRSFDVPFIMIRSAVFNIKPTLNLMSNRYLTSQSRNAKHIDLLDQMSFYGAVRRKGSLHLFCKTFGISSPKAAGITGDDVARLFAEKKYYEIAEYNSWDLIATWELYKIWQAYFKF